MFGRRKLIPIACAAAMALLVAGCASGSKGDAGAGSAGARDAGGVTGFYPDPASLPPGTPIKIGVMCSCSGSPSFTSYNVPVEQVVKAWADATNAAGGVAGHPVQLILEDDQLNPGTGSTAAKDLVAQNVVDVVDISSISGVFAPITSGAKIPVVGVYQTSAEFETNPYFYPEGQTNSGVNAAVIAMAKQAGATNVGILYCAESPICAQTVPGMTPPGAAAGVPVVYSAKISATAPNYTAQCLAARQAGVTALLLGASAATQARAAQDCHKQGYDPIFLTQGQGSGESLFSTPGLNDHMWSEYGNLPFFADSPAVTAFNTAMDKYQPGVRQNKDLFTQNAFMGWVSMQLLATGIKAGGLTQSSEPTAAMVVQGLDSLKGETLDGTAPPLTFSAGQPHKIECNWVGQVKNSTPAVLNSGNYTCPGSR